MKIASFRDDILPGSSSGKVAISTTLSFGPRACSARVSQVRIGGLGAKQMLNLGASPAGCKGQSWLGYPQIPEQMRV